MVHWGILAAAGCLFVVQATGALWGGAVVGLVYGVGGVPPLVQWPMWLLPLTTVGLWVGYLAGPALINRMTGSGPMVDFDLRASPTQVLVAVALGVGTQLVLLPLLYEVVTRVLSGDPAATAETIVGRVDGGLDVLLLVLAVVVMAPLAEEWFYRGMLLSAVTRRFGPVVAIVATSAVFALIHREVILLPGLFVFALVLAGLTASTGRLGPAVVAHMAFNASTVVVLLT